MVFGKKTTYDENGNKIYYKDSNGYWEYYVYDKNNKLIYYDNSLSRKYDK